MRWFHWWPSRFSRSETESAPCRSRIGEVDWGDNGFIVQGGITHGQVLRFNVARLAIVNPGPPGTVAPGPPGTVVGGPPTLQLRVFDSNGNVLASNTYVFPNQNQNGGGVWISFFDLSADQLPASAFDNTGRAQVTGIVRAIPGPHAAPGPESSLCGFVASGEIFNIGNSQTLVHIAGTPMSRCR